MATRKTAAAKPAAEEPVDEPVGKLVDEEVAPAAGNPVDESSEGPVQADKDAPVEAASPQLFPGGTNLTWTRDGWREAKQ